SGRGRLWCGRGLRRAPKIRGAPRPANQIGRIDAQRPADGGEKQECPNAAPAGPAEGEPARAIASAILNLIATRQLIETHVAYKAWRDDGSHSLARTIIHLHGRPKSRLTLRRDRPRLLILRAYRDPNPRTRRRAHPQAPPLSRHGAPLSPLAWGLAQRPPRCNAAKRGPIEVIGLRAPFAVAGCCHAPHRPMTGCNPAAGDAN